MLKTNKCPPSNQSPKDQVILKFTHLLESNIKSLTLRVQDITKSLNEEQTLFSQEPTQEDRLSFKSENHLDHKRTFSLEVMMNYLKLIANKRKWGFDIREEEE